MCAPLAIVTAPAPAQTRAAGAGRVLLLPGWQGSGPGHWQSRWEVAHGYERVEQHDWLRPLRGDWIARLEEVLLQRAEPAVLVAHSLGCLLVAAWAAHSRNTHLVNAALLVAPADVQREELRPLLSSWAPAALRPLPFRSLLVASRNDPYCSLARAREFASAWACDLVDCGSCGHINADSGLGDWAQGHQWLVNRLGMAPESRPAMSWKGQANG